MTNHIIDQLQAAGYSNEGNNRTYAIKALNKVIESGIVSFEFLEQDVYQNQGRSFIPKSKAFQTPYMVTVFGKRYFGHSVPKKLKTFNFGQVDYIKRNIDSISITEILVKVARLLSIAKEGRDFIANGSCKCSKCNGNGFIPQFAHVAEGVCFECGGTGGNHKAVQSLLEELK